ncbi:putative heat shock protein 70 [Tanacetum coccineum]
MCISIFHLLPNADNALTLFQIDRYRVCRSTGIQWMPIEEFAAHSALLRDKSRKFIYVRQGSILQLFYGLLGSWTAYLISVLYVVDYWYESVQRMVNKTEKSAKEDKEKRDTIYTKNQADSVAYQTEKQLK